MKQQLNQFVLQLQQYWQKLLSTPSAQQLISGYQRQSPRDQALLKTAVAIIIAALVLVLFYVPMLNSRTQAANALEKNLATYNLIASNAGRFASVGDNTAADSILSAVTNEARSQGINLSRYEQDGSNLRVWLERVPFDDAISWLELLETKQGIQVSQMSIDKTTSLGRVDIRATLSR